MASRCGGEIRRRGYLGNENKNKKKEREIKMEEQERGVTKETRRQQRWEKNKNEWVSRFNGWHKLDKEGKRQVWGQLVKARSWRE